MLAAVVVAIAIGLYVLSSGSSGGPGGSLIGQPVPSSFVSTLNGLANAPYGPANTTYAHQFHTIVGNTMRSGNFPIILYVGAEYCPYCAEQRWPLVLALMRFGTFTGISYMESTAADVYPNTATFSFLNAGYRSDYIVFQHYEYEDRSGNPLQTVPSNYTSVWTQYGQGSIPFVDIAGRWYISGASFLPTRMTGQNWTQIAAQISAGMPLGIQIKQVANAFTSAICSVDGNQPSNVCSNPSITGEFPTSQGAPSVSFAMGMPMSNASEWATVQYRQIAWTRNASTPTR